MSRRLRAVAPYLAVYALLLGVGLGIATRFTVVTVAGGSMEPALRPGDLVVVARRERPAVGEIVLMHAGRSLVLHRVTRVDRDGSVRTRGDANPISDLSATRARDLKGTARVVIPIGTLIARWRQGGAYATLPAQTHSTRR
jgi:signal peptidase I